MRVELSSGSWVEVRDRLQGGDRTAVNTLVRITVKQGDDRIEQEVGGDLTDRMHDTLLANIITGWSYPEPIPSQGGGVDAVAALDLDDYLELHAKTDALLKRVTAKLPNRETPAAG